MQNVLFYGLEWKAHAKGEQEIAEKEIEKKEEYVQGELLQKRSHQTRGQHPALHLHLESAMSERRVVTPHAAGPFQ